MADADKWSTRGEDEDEGEDEEIDETGYKTVKDALLFAIEISPSTTKPRGPKDEKTAQQETSAAAALKCAYTLMQQRIISNPNDYIGILLFGTKQSKLYKEDEHPGGVPSYPHCYLLSDLGIPAAADVKQLKSMVEDEDQSRSLLQPSQEGFSMANVLFCASRIFTTKAPNFASRRLFIVTDNDDPHANDKALKSSSTVRAKDLYDLGVIIELFPISYSDDSFDRAKYYDDIIYHPSEGDPEAPGSLSTAVKISSSSDGISLLKSLLSSIQSKSVPRRALFSHVPLEIAPDLKISVKGFIYFKRQEPARSCYVWLKGEKAQIVTGHTAQMAEENARSVEKAEIKKAYKFGGEQVPFTPEEVSSIRNFGDPVIRIIGFKPLSMLSVWANIKYCTFVYPSEEDYIGSTRVFSALYQKLLRDSKFGLVWYIARKNAAPVLAALVAGAEQKSETGDQSIPSGMWLVPLPFADDIRQNPDTVHVPAPDKVIDVMRTVVQQLQLPKGKFDPLRYPNPALQWHYKILQAMALDEDLPEKPEDKTVPRYKQIDKRTGEYVGEWFEVLDEQYEAWRKDHAGSGVAAKRGPPNDTSSTKRVKTEGAGSAGSMTDEQMEVHFNKHTVNKLTVPVIKEWVEAKGLDANGKKADLVDRVEQWFEKKG